MREHGGVFTECLEVMSTRFFVREHGFVFTGSLEVMSSGVGERTRVCVYWVCRGHVQGCWWAVAENMGVCVLCL